MDAAKDIRRIELNRQSSVFSERVDQNGCPRHKWQGKVYRWSEKPQTSTGTYDGFEDTCGYGDVTGILGANCRHSFWPFIEGVSERTYTDSELEAMKPENRPKIKFEGRKYDDYQASQKQREIERTIRKWKRMETAYRSVGLEDDANAAGVRIGRLEQKYKDFSKASGLPLQRDRMNVSYVDNESEEKAEIKRQKKEAVKK